MTNPYSHADPTPMTLPPTIIVQLGTDAVDAMKRLLTVNEDDNVVARALREMDFVNAKRRVHEVRERIPGAPAHRHSGRLQSRRSGKY